MVANRNATGMAQRFRDLAGLKLILLQELDGMKAARNQLLQPLDKLTRDCQQPSEALILQVSFQKRPAQTMRACPAGLQVMTCSCSAQACDGDLPCCVILSTKAMNVHASALDCVHRLAAVVDAEET